MLPFYHSLYSRVAMDVKVPHVPALDSVDNATAELITQMLSDDIQELSQTSKGKSRIGEMSDGDLAIATYQREIE